MTGDGFMATFDRPGRAILATAEFERRVGEAGSRSGWGSTRARSRCEATMSGVWRYTLPPGSWTRPNLARS
jgi:hypothetical protein